MSAQHECKVCSVGCAIPHWFRSPYPRCQHPAKVDLLKLELHIKRRKMDMEVEKNIEMGNESE
jgi:hypothetical protein